MTEEDYRRRKGHPNYKAQVATEKLVIKLGKDAEGPLRTYVVAAGLPYGQGEDPFHWLFKSAWLLHEPALSVPGAGTNVVPTVHVHDLAFAILNVAERHPDKHYIIAVDDAMSTLGDIASAVATALGNGKTENVSKAAALTLPGLSQLDHDLLTVDLRLEAATMKDFRIEWAAQSGLIENMDRVVVEYRRERKLLPLRVAILGPPASGKSSISRDLCSRYKLEYLHAAGVITAHLTRLEVG